MRLLFAEDEPDLNRIVTKKLTEEGYSVDSCLNGEDALYYFESAEYDVAVLDIMMPGLDGLQVLKKIRAAGNMVPVLFLTARDSVRDRVQGLDAGAEDYLVKPFSFEELMARLRVITRNKETQKGSVLTAGDLVMDIAAHTVHRGDKEIPLSAKEFQILQYMMFNQNLVLSREKIEEHIWNFDYEGGTNVIDVYMYNLRKKIDQGFDVKRIQTIRGVGYKLNAEEENDG